MRYKVTTTFKIRHWNEGYVITEDTVVGDTINIEKFSEAIGMNDIIKIVIEKIP